MRRRPIFYGMYKPDSDGRHLSKSFETRLRVRWSPRIPQSGHRITQKRRGRASRFTYGQRGIERQIRTRNGASHDRSRMRVWASSEITHNGLRSQQRITNEILGLARRVVEREGWVDARVEGRRRVQGACTVLSEDHRLRCGRSGRQWHRVPSRRRRPLSIRTDETRRVL